MATKASRSSGSSNGDLRRMTVSMPPSTEGGGSNASRGMRRVSESSHHGSHPKDRSVLRSGDARLRAASNCNKRSARSGPSTGLSRRRRRIDVVSAKGTLPNARHDPSGIRTLRTSPCTIRTAGRPANARSSRSARTPSSSTAVTRAARAAKGRVRRPVPAPISRTCSVEQTPAAWTSSSATTSLRMKCWPLDRAPVGRGERDRPSTDPHHRDRAHRLFLPDHRRTRGYGIGSAGRSDPR